MRIVQTRFVQSASCTVVHVCDGQECGACQSCLLTAAGLPLAKAPVRRLVSPDPVDPVTAVLHASRGLSWTTFFSCWSTHLSVVLPQVLE